MELKNVYRGDEVKFAAMFRALQPALLADFIAAHPNFQAGEKFTGVPYYQSPNGNNAVLYNEVNAWKMSGIKHDKFGLLSMFRSRYPTAFALVEAFGDACQMAGYSIVEPNAIIYRHTGVENRDAKSIRIHIPLYVPEGDIGFEVEGEIVLWNDVFSFNNQKLHSVWNNTSERRLVLLLDLSRDTCDLPPAPAWTPGCNDHVSAFEKTRDPNHIPIN